MIRGRAIIFSCPLAFEGGLVSVGSVVGVGSVAGCVVGCVGCNSGSVGFGSVGSDSVDSAEGS